MEKKYFYITTTLPYVNAEPHVGFAMELIRADIVARAKKLEGWDVFFNTGTDEHGQKLWTASQEAGEDVQSYVDRYAESFKNLKPLLGISDDVVFIRTTDKKHEVAAQAFWNICKENGFIYKKNYKIKYCVGCELEKTDSELNEEGRCPVHPNKDIELRDEDNYFFKFSSFQKPLQDFYMQNPNFVVPDFRFNEIKAFVERGLEDFSISRLASKMPWGVPVPGDETQVMYVWFDALVNYISTLGWPENTDLFSKFWTGKNNIQYCGKDNLRQQSAMWQAMLMAAGLPNSYQIVINGFFTGGGGIKMSKSLGNVISPEELVREYGTEALRYFVVGEVSMFEDSPFTKEAFHDAYNAKLANGIGNLTSRIMKMAETNLDAPVSVHDIKIDKSFFALIDTYELGNAVKMIFDKITLLDVSIQKQEPFKLIKTEPEVAKKLIQDLSTGLYEIALMLEPFLPETAKHIQNLVLENKSPQTPLFLRK